MSANGATRAHLRTTIEHLQAENMRLRAALQAATGGDGGTSPEALREAVEQAKADLFQMAHSEQHPYIGQVLDRIATLAARAPTGSGADASPAAGGTRGEDDEMERVMLEVEAWAVERFVSESALSYRRKDNAWAVCQELRRLRAALAEAEARGRRQGLEEAAALLEKGEEGIHNDWDSGEAAKAVRALAGGGGPEEGGT